MVGSMCDDSKMTNKRDVIVDMRLQREISAPPMLIIGFSVAHKRFDISKMIGDSGYGEIYQTIDTMIR